MATETYSHRNGEMKVPEKPGWYWVKGVLRLPKEIYDMAGCFFFADWHNKSFLTRVDGKFVVLGEDAGYSGFAVGDWSDCRFWGPDKAPWILGKQNAEN